MPSVVLYFVLHVQHQLEMNYKTESKFIEIMVGTVLDKKEAIVIA